MLQSQGPFFGLRFGRLTGNSIPFLNASYQLVLPAGDGLPIIVGELAPTLLGGACKLHPLAFYLIPIHSFLSCNNQPTWLRSVFLPGSVPPLTAAAPNEAHHQVPVARSVG